MVLHNNADQGKNAGDNGLLIDKQRVNYKRALPSSNNKNGRTIESVNLIPWSSQNSSGGQNNVGNNRIEEKNDRSMLSVPENGNFKANNSASSSNDSTPSSSLRSSSSYYSTEDVNNNRNRSNRAKYTPTSEELNEAKQRLRHVDTQNGVQDNQLSEANRELQAARQRLRPVVPENQQNKSLSNATIPSNSRRSSDSSNSDSDRNSESLSNDSTPSISRQSSFFSNSDGYPTKEEEQKATDTEIIDKNREPGTQENFAPSENNGTNTNSFGQNFLGHLREEYGDYPSYDLSSSSSRRSSVSSTNSKFSNADHQSDSGNESSSNDANGFGSTFSNHYNDSLFDN
ncbi:MAG: hypothetical protein K5766_02300 [Alphaproteobacteria bacterium]|nr:hypothetical protein [Alphaproteobacteria bacterium]